MSIPFRNCIEPSNVEAGGQHCPIRYQCSGCGFYLPLANQATSERVRANQAAELANRLQAELDGARLSVRRMIREQATGAPE